MPELPPNLLFSVFAFIGFLLAGIPLPWHVQSWNMGSGMFMAWTSLGCLLLFINSIVWNNNAMNWAPVWCDITSHYLVGASVGIPASSFCIVHRLYYMTKLQVVSVDKAQRRREITVDASIGIGFPCIVMAIYYVVQGHRFLIFEQVGCYFSITLVPLAFPLIFMWPLAIGCISLVYAVLAFRRAFLLKGQLKNLLHEGFSIDSGYYWRLMTLCCSEIIFTVPLSIYVIFGDTILESSLPSNMSWAAIHSGFSQIPNFPTIIWEDIPGSAIRLDSIRWMYILCAIVCFAFFGWARGVRGFYGQMFWSICRRLGYPKPPDSESLSTTSRITWIFARARNPTLPSHHADQQIGPNGLSLPFQARVRRRPGSVTSLSSELRSNIPTQHTDSISLESIALPEPTFARDRWSSDAAQLV